MNKPSLPRPGQIAAAARYYAEMGFTIFPTAWPVFGEDGRVRCSCGQAACATKEGRRSIGKHPLNTAKHPFAPRGLFNATNDVATVQRWWSEAPDAGIGVRTGRRAEEGQPPEGSGYVILDVDTGYDAQGRYKDGDYELSLLEDVVGKLPETWVTKTGSGGKHIWFQHPGGDLVVANRQLIDLPKPAGWKEEAYLDARGQKIVLKALQIRGDGGYGILAPSMHHSGNQYAWDVRPTKDGPPAAPLPATLLQAIYRERGGRPQDHDMVSQEGWPAEAIRIKRARAYLARLPIAVSGSHGQTDLFKAALWLVRGFALPPGTAYDLLMSDYSPRCVPPWDSEREEVARKVEEVVAKGGMPYGYAFRQDADRAIARELARLGQQATGLVSDARVHEVDDTESEAPVDEGAWGYGANDTDAEPAQAGAGGGAAAAALVASGAPPGLPPGLGGSPGGGGDDDGGDFIQHDFAVGDEIEVARAVIAHLERNGRSLFHEEGAFWRYNPDTGIWEKLTYEWVMGQIQRFAHNQVGQKDVLKLRAAMVEGVRKLVVGELIRTASHRSFAKAPLGIAFRNGFLRIETDMAAREANVQFVAHHPDNLSRHRLDVDWTDTPLPAPKLQRFFANIFHDVTDPDEVRLREWLLQEFVGASMAGVAPLFAKALFIQGPPGNGKSELLHLIKSMFPEQSAAAVPPSKWGQQFQAIGLVGALVNVCDDISGADLKSEASTAFRQIITGSNFHCDVKSKTPFYFRCRAGHIMSMNAAPKPAEAHDGFWRRCLMLPLTGNFREGPGAKLRENAMGVRVAHEEPAQLVQWAVAGLLRLIRQGAYSTPQGSVEALREWKEEACPVYRFLVNAAPPVRKQLTSPAGIRAVELWKNYDDMIRAESGDAMRETLTTKAFGTKAKETNLVTHKRIASGGLYRANQALVDLWAELDQKLAAETARYDSEVKQAAGKPFVLPTVPPGKDEAP